MRHEQLTWDLSLLRKAQADGALVFVLGAGINARYGLPLWSDLLQRLLIDSGRLPRLRNRGRPVPKEAQQEEAAAIRRSLETLSPDPLLQAAIVRAAYPSENAWNEALRRHLDAVPNRHSAADEQLPLRVIARMIVSAALKHRRKHFVLTFNFDNLLEKAIEAEIEARPWPGVFADANKPRVKSISTEAAFHKERNRSGIFICHLHGFLEDLQPETVLDNYSYLDVMKSGHWSRECFSAALPGPGATALFIGLSLTDPNLRFLLTDWARTDRPLSAFYLAAPLPIPQASNLAWFRQLAFVSRTILDLYDEVLDSLQLVSYHLSSWSELVTILEVIEEGG